MKDHNVEICHVCGGPLLVKRVEKLLRGGVQTAVVEVDAEVCQRCGEQLFDPDTVRRFEEIRRKLAQQETAEFLAIGQSFQVSQAGLPTA